MPASVPIIWTSSSDPYKARDLQMLFSDSVRSGKANSALACGFVDAPACAAAAEHIVECTQGCACAAVHLLAPMHTHRHTDSNVCLM